MPEQDASHIQPPLMVASGEALEVTQVLGFMLGEQVYGLGVAHIYEVVRMVEVTPVPDSPPDMLGVIDYRGTVVPVLDLQKRFTAQATNITLVTPIIIAWTGRHAVGLVVRDIREVFSIAPDDIMAPEQFGQPQQHIAGVAKIEGGLLLILHPAGLLGGAVPALGGESTHA